MYLRRLEEPNSQHVLSKPHPIQYQSVFKNENEITRSIHGTDELKKATIKREREREIPPDSKIKDSPIRLHNP